MTGSSVPTVNEAETKGIRVDFVVPEGTERIDVSIDRINSSVYEGSVDSSVDPNGTFFYPFVKNGQTYKVLINFLKDKKDADDYSLGGITLGWKVLDVTAKGGAGEVLMTKGPKISIDENGDFTFVEPTFSNVNLISNWYMRVASVHGRSWLHKDGERQKWMGNCYVSNDELTEVHNIYLDGDFWNESDPINFICYDPWVEYEYDDGKIWKYKWNSTVEEPLDLPKKTDMWEEVDVTSADLPKLVGTWKCNWTESWDEYNCDCKGTLLIESSGKITFTEIRTLTNKNGSEFTEEQKTNSAYTFSEDNKSGVLEIEKDVSDNLDNGKIKLHRIGNSLNYYYYDNGCLIFEKQ